MDFSAIFTLIALASNGTVKRWIDIGANVAMELQKAHPHVIPVLEAAAANEFPALAGTVHAIAAVADSWFDPHGTIWVQSKMNIIMPPIPPLVEDGINGKLTKAAVTAYQIARKIQVDGWVGPETEGSMMADLKRLGLS